MKTAVSIIAAIMLCMPAFADNDHDISSPVTETSGMPEAGSADKAKKEKKKVM